MPCSVIHDTIESVHSVTHDTYLVYHTLWVLLPSDLQPILGFKSRLAYFGACAL